MISLEKKIEMNKQKIMAIKGSIKGVVKRMQTRVQMLDSCCNEGDMLSTKYYSAKITEDSLMINSLVERLSGREELLHCQINLLEDDQTGETQ